MDSGSGLGVDGARQDRPDGINKSTDTCKDDLVRLKDAIFLVVSLLVFVP